MSKFPYFSGLKFYWDAQTIYSAHSPFVYDFFVNVLNNHSWEEELIAIESEREKLLSSNASISFKDYGAGSSVGQNRANRIVREVAKNSLSGQWQCRIMYNLIRHYKAVEILEIGTSFGISTAYLSLGAPHGQITSLEGNPASVDIAQKVWNNMSLKNIEIILGNFDQTLQPSIANIVKVDLAFIDGNHRKKATVDYYHFLKAKHHKNSIFVIDDIYWSKEMNDAWKKIIRDQDVAFSIDLFRMGILFFDHSIMEKQHFKLIPYKLKPFSIGLFG